MKAVSSWEQMDSVFASRRLHTFSVTRLRFILAYVLHVLDHRQGYYCCFIWEMASWDIVLPSPGGGDDDHFERCRIINPSEDWWGVPDAAMTYECHGTFSVGWVSKDVSSRGSRGGGASERSEHFFWETEEDMWGSMSSRGCCEQSHGWTGISPAGDRVDGPSGQELDICVSCILDISRWSAEGLEICLGSDSVGYLYDQLSKARLHKCRQISGSLGVMQVKYVVFVIIYLIFSVKLCN